MKNNQKYNKIMTAQSEVSANLVLFSNRYTLKGKL